MSEKEEKKAAGCLSEFTIFLLAVVVGLASIALVVYGAMCGEKGIELAGIGLSAAFALLVFVIPYLRRNVYIRWLAWCALGDAAWWTYLMFSGGE